MLNASYITFNNDTYSNYTINEVIVKKIRSFILSVPRLRGFLMYVF